MTGNLSKKRVDMEVAESIKASINEAKEVTENVKSAVEKYPKIVDGYWHVWDLVKGDVVNSGVPATGPKGEQGEKGDQGPQGEKGETGENGQNGKDGYNPMRGVDYWTDTDKEEIKAYIDGQIEENGGLGGDITIDNIMSDTSENAVQNKAIKQYVDGRIATFKNSKFWYAIETSATEECKITTRNGISQTNFVQFSVKASQAVNTRVTVIVTLLNSIKANSCYLELHDTSGLDPIRRVNASEVSGKVATFSFNAYGDCSLRAMWTETPATNSCTVEVKYDQDVRDLFDSKAGIDDFYSKPQIDEQIGDIETALDGIIDIQNTLIGGDGV